MTKHKVIAIDLAKNVFQVCGLNRNQRVVFNMQLKRADLTEFMAKQAPTKVAMEACYSSHYWARVFSGMGHEVMLLPAQHVTPFVRGNKSDYNDAVAIAEASLRPNITRVPIKSVEQQDVQALHRIRERYLTQRTSLINQTRGLLSEYGIICPQGLAAFTKLLCRLTEDHYGSLSPIIKRQLVDIYADYRHLSARIHRLNEELAAIAKNNAICQRLLTIPGIGVINATGLYSAIGHGQQFTSGRQLAVWLGLTPRQASSGEKSRSSGITKRGNRYLRTQLVHGARAALYRSKDKEDRLSHWANQLVVRRGIQKATVALAAKMARIAWTIITKAEDYQAMPAR